MAQQEASASDLPQLPPGVTLETEEHVFWGGAQALHETQPTPAECKAEGANYNNVRCFQQVGIWLKIPGNVIAQFCVGGLYPITALMTPAQLANPLGDHQHLAKILWTNKSHKPPLTSCPG